MLSRRSMLVITTNITHGWSVTFSNPGIALKRAWRDTAELYFARSNATTAVRIEEKAAIKNKSARSCV